jgi:hypothetical protein
MSLGPTGTGPSQPRAGVVAAGISHSPRPITTGAMKLNSSILVPFG